MEKKKGYHDVEEFYLEEKKPTIDELYQEQLKYSAKLIKMLNESRNKALEEAANLADELGDAQHRICRSMSECTHYRKVAIAIRQLKEK